MKYDNLVDQLSTSQKNLSNIIFQNFAHSFSQESMMLPKEVGKRIISNEDFDDSSGNEIRNDIQATFRLIDDAVGLAKNEAKDEDTTFTEQQRRAALGAIIAASVPDDFRTQTELTNDNLSSIRGTLVNGGGDLEGSNVGRVNFSNEAYDDTTNRETVTYSAYYNLMAARQDPFGEAFYPTVVLSPNSACVTITTDLMCIINNNVRSLDSVNSNFFNATNVIRAIIDPSILKRDLTRCYPVYRQGYDDKIKALFVDPDLIAPKTIKLETEEEIQTAPIAIGKRIPDYIRLCATDEMLSKSGQSDSTDQLDPYIKLSTLYMVLKGKDSSGNELKEVFTFKNLDILPESTFIAAPGGDSRTMLLHFSVNNFYIGKDTKLANGSDSMILANYLNMGIDITLSVSVSGNVNLNTGVLDINAIKPTVESIKDSSGVVLGKNDGDGLNIVNIFEGCEFVGADIIARLINSNIRQRGQLLDVNQQRLVYGIPILSPITALRPVGKNNEDDPSLLNTLITTTYVTCSNAAVRALLKTRDHLSKLPKNIDANSVYSNNSLGAGRYFVKPWYKRYELDVKAALNSIKSSEKMHDIEAVLVNTIRKMAYDARYESGYDAAADLVYSRASGGKRKIRVIIGTDPRIANYLQVTGDFRTLGEEYDVTVVSTLNMEMTNSIAITFGKPNELSPDVADPLHFGNMFWRPELTHSLKPMNRNGAYNKEVAVQPSFIHVSHCPILGWITVKNLGDAVNEITEFPVRNSDQNQQNQVTGFNYAS
jgi:hypothetical protein